MRAMRFPAYKPAHVTCGNKVSDANVKLKISSFTRNSASAEPRRDRECALGDPAARRRGTRQPLRLSRRLSGKWKPNSFQATKTFYGYNRTNSSQVIKSSRNS